MQVIVRDDLHNRTTYFDNVSYVHLHETETKDGYKTTLYKMYDNDGHRWSGQLDACDKLIVDDFATL